jgi:hypothetical protein
MKHTKKANRSGTQRSASARKAGGRGQYCLSLSDTTLADLDFLADIKYGSGRSGVVARMAREIAALERARSTA